MSASSIHCSYGGCTPTVKTSLVFIIYQAPGLSVMPVYSGHFHPLSGDTLVDLQCLSSDRYWVYCWLILTVHSLLSLENIITNFPGFTLALVPGYYANQLLDILYLYLPLREIGVRWANHESACHSSRATRRPRLSLLRQNPNSSSLLRLQDGAEVVRLPEGSLTKPQEDEVGGESESETFLTSTPLHCQGVGATLQASDFGPISASNRGQAVRLFGGMDQNRSKHLLEGYSLPFSSLPPLTSPVFLASFQNPEKRRALHVAVKEMEMKGAIEVVRTPSPGFYSRLFLVPKARGTWRPIIDLSALNTHIQCPSFKMETNGSLLKGSIHPSFGQYLRFCHEGVVWQFRALPFGLNTAPRVFTMVTAPVVAYAHLNGVSLHVYLDDWLLNPRSEESAKQQTQWLLDLCARLGWVVNVEKSSLTPSQVAIYLGISLDTRVGLAYPSERRIERWLSISEVFLAGQAQPALLWLRLLGHLVSLEKLVPYGRLRIRPIQFQLRSGWSQIRDHPLIQVSLDQGTRDSILWWRTHSSLHKGIPLGSPLIEAFLFTDSSAVGWGAHMDKRTASGHGRAAHQCAGTECDLAWSPSLRGYSPRLKCCHYVRQCLCLFLSEKSGGHSVSTDVPHGHRYLRMGRRTVHNTDTQTSPWASQCVSRSSEPQRSDSENRMESEFSRSTACIPNLGQSTCGSVCTQVQHQTSNLHVSDSRTGGLEGRQSSQIMGRSVRLRVPTNGSDQTDSGQVNLAQSGADPHIPPLAETGMVSGPPTTVHSFPVGTSTNSKVAEAIILSNIFIRGLGF